MRFQIYRDRQRQWRWRLIAMNGKTVADSAEGYRRRRGCLHGVQLVRDSVNAPLKGNVLPAFRSTAR